MVLCEAALPGQVVGEELRQEAPGKVWSRRGPRGSRPVLRRGGDDVTEAELGFGHHLGVGVRGQPQVVLRAAKVGVAHVAGEVGQHHGQVCAGGGPTSQVGDGEAMAQRVRMGPPTKWGMPASAR